jgi:3-phosphoshikimate 1-carboxyvinyltransferase
MQRACAAALLRNGKTRILNPGHSNDDEAALGVISALGAEIVAGGAAIGLLDITSAGVQPRRLEVNCGESGLGIRMFAPIIALSDQAITVQGEGSLLSRPMDFFDEVFPRLGIRVVSDKGRLPLHIQGPLVPRTIEIDGSLSSQFLTGLLMSFAAAGAKDVSIRVTNLKSKPYIDLTVQVMRHFGWVVENRDYTEFYFPGEDDAESGAGISGPGKVLAGDDRPAAPAVPPAGPVLEYTVEGDWSGGAFLLVAGAIAGKITVKGLDTASAQADKAILQALKDCGACLTVEKQEIVIGPGAEKDGPHGALKAFQFDATDCPDLFPPLVALASFCEGTTVIAGVGRLAHKESNRALTLQEEFGKMGIGIRLEGDHMLISGGGPVSGAEVHSRHDHRIAMACAVAALRADKPTTIGDAEAIDKSYPDFYEHLRMLGADVKIRQAAGNVESDK